MKIIKIPQNLKTIIFDIDSTLYTNEEYAFEQVDCQVRRFASERGISNDEARKLVADFREKFARENGAFAKSSGNPKANYEIIEIDTATLEKYGAGYYQVKITRSGGFSGNVTQTVRIGLAWEQR